MVRVQDPITGKRAVLGCTRGWHFAAGGWPSPWAGMSNGYTAMMGVSILGVLYSEGVVLVCLALVAGW